jgi:hypothetical protein
MARASSGKVVRRDDLSGGVMSFFKCPPVTQKWPVCEQWYVTEHSVENAAWRGAAFTALQMPRKCRRLTDFGSCA